tara:strand:+ start:212 stop:574 length:363 start_codon:yes stop_codon:yes gene_type:complete
MTSKQSNCESISVLFSENSNWTDICEECEEKKQIVLCEKCGGGVCENEDCSFLFPHYNNTLFVICRRCCDEVFDKFKLVMDFTKLKLLKNKIKTQKTKTTMTKTVTMKATIKPTIKNIKN